MTGATFPDSGVDAAWADMKRRRRAVIAESNRASKMAMLRCCIGRGVRQFSRMMDLYLASPSRPTFLFLNGARGGGHAHDVIEKLRLRA